MHYQKVPGTFAGCNASNAMQTKQNLAMRPRNLQMRAVGEAEHLTGETGAECAT